MLSTNLNGSSTYIICSVCREIHDDGNTVRQYRWFSMNLYTLEVIIHYIFKQTILPPLSPALGLKSAKSPLALFETGDTEAFPNKSKAFLDLLSAPWKKESNIFTINYILEYNL